jgi:hypothetical protein
MLDEYRALRTEINSRISSRATLLGFLAASVALLSKNSALSDHEKWGAVAAVLGAGIIYWYRSHKLIKKAAGRVANVEEAINKKAETAYGLPQNEQLLRWELVNAGRPTESTPDTQRA